MFVRLGKFLEIFFYWIGWGLAVLLIGIATILSFILNPLIPLVLCGIGLIVWVFALELKNNADER
jgi:hypothetical protein